MNQQVFNKCRKCGHPVPAPFEAHVARLGGCPDADDYPAVAADPADTGR